MIEDLCALNEINIGQHTFKVLELKEDNFDALKNLLISEFPETYLSKSSNSAFSAPSSLPSALALSKAISCNSIACFSIFSF